MNLRKLELKDAEGMLEWMHDPEIQKSFRYCMGTTRKEDVLEFIRTAETRPVEGKSIHYAIVDEKDEYLGTISLKDVSLTAKSAEYAISLRRKAQGMGIAAQATRELLKLAFETFKMQRVYLNVLADNDKAIRLYEKCGFTYEGEFRRHLFLRGEYKTLKWYSMLDEEYFERISRGGINNRYFLLHCRPLLSNMAYKEVA